MSGFAGWNDVVEAVRRVGQRNAGRDRGRGASASGAMHGAGPGFNRSFTPEEITEGLALGGLIPEALLDSRVRMRNDSGGQSTVMAWVRSIARGDKERLAEWQKRLYAAGLYQDTEPIYGYFDQATAGALSMLATEVLRNGNDYTPSQILDILTMNVDLDGDGIPDAMGRSQPTIVTTNPLDLRQTAQAVGADLTGRRIDDAQADSLMAGFTEMELAEGQARIRGGGSTVAAPTPGAYAEQRLRETQAPEIDSYAALGAFNTLLQMVGLAG